jgi:hydroxymethylglutaryl-CoA reductase (NADPH)
MPAVKEPSGGGDLDKPREQARPSPAPGALPRRLPATTDSSREAMLTRQQRLRDEGYGIEQIAGRGPEIEPERLAGSIEGFIGFARVPLGVAGPVRIAGAAASGDFFVPLATSEGTLIASFQHAFNAINRCGGARALCSSEQVGRAPCF